MYDPIQDGIVKNVLLVSYKEEKPPNVFSKLVHSFWELKTDIKLPDDFFLHALPDACVNILFNQKDTRIAGVTALRTTYEELNLGKEFHYVGIQFFPGVWQGNHNETTDSFVGTPYLGDLPLIDTSNKLTQLDFAAKQSVLSELVSQLIERKLVAVNVVTEKILLNLDVIHTVADMANITNISSRQLQRILKSSTGFTPHDLIKVLRLQQSFKQHYLEYYTDQSHFIHSFRKITGYTPTEYYRKFDV
ncbi:helix-turn-helix domain-containing protein [Vibrio genomosp. F10]|uniref:helix-turn-helix domain-containing protein n=1 Tax=Vibrio genomosp. F10 TaxID=723171 RepID=UPI000302AE96|nr:AraC family transcriptional regulator [Vibrio genomosp. F10]OEF07133.1 transcriptional regulator [Vibrio genomosp. F10 str. 9ZB36]